MAIFYKAVLITFALVILFFDRTTPAGHADWLLYYIVIILASYTGGRIWIWSLCILCTIFTYIGLFISQPSPTPFVFAIENRTSSVFVLWVLTYALYRNQRLTLSLQKRTTDLISANRDLESFSYSVSHDLKNPLIVIGGFGQMLSDNATDRLNKDEKDGLMRIISESKRMSEIIADLLRLSRIGNQEIKFESIDLGKIAMESVENLKQQSFYKKIEIVIQPDMITRGDPGLVRVLFDNLIGNALKFSCTSKDPRVEISCSNEFGTRVYIVRDNGVGFDMSKVDKIFDPFTRLHSPKDFAGTGIGLSIARKIVEKHNGKIWAKSEIGKGATFLFTLSAIPSKLLP